MSDEIKAVDGKEATDAVLKKCPRCGWSNTDKPVPNQEDLKEFMRCMLGSRQFSKVYPLYEGAMELRFSTLSTADTDVLNSCILNCGKTDELDIKTFSFKAKLLYLLVSMKLDREVISFSRPSFGGLKNDELAAAVEEEYIKRFGKLQDPVLQLVLRSMLVFIDLQNILTAAALDNSFWKAAGPY